MKRRILIIKGQSNSINELKNDKKYISCYIDYFKSHAGGCYEDDEIISLEEPSLNEIKIHNRDIDSSDSLIVLLLGHGATSNGKHVFQLQKNVIINPGQLIFKTRIQLFIVESCRNIINKISVKKINNTTPKFKYGGLFDLDKRPKTKHEVIEAYNKAISASNDGCTYLFSANVNQEAYNYYFLRYLVTTALDKHQYTTCDHVFSIEEMFDLVKNKVQDKCLKTPGIKAKQTPIMTGKGDFPFVVSIM
ncbi:hypothetical protein K5X82_15455 [Halosquirtibacter xylanolyticus]|uniref:hypothetical protein n=1 Tax=Halosquirtibacter xylanolyticus TaxID=3374599 RepID=UPI003748E558|nr:hypothetical protein K5X82_15455 [Prolixibacteraceae bacterium]